MRHQTIAWSNDDVLSIGPPEKKFIEIFIQIKTFLFTKLHFQIVSA